MNNRFHYAAPTAALLAVLTLAACSGSDNHNSTEPTASDSAAQAATSAAAAPACEVSLATGLSTVAVAFDGVDYEVRVYTPVGLDVDNALVLDLHGSSSNGVVQATVSGLDAVADANGFIVAEPVGVLEAEAYQEMPDGSWAWNVPGVPTTAGEYPPEGSRDDVAFLAAVIEQISEQGCVDAGQVFATGYSGGGRMASALACERADLVAAVAPVAGLRAGRAIEGDLLAVDPATCEPSQPVAIQTFHGTADFVNPYEGNDDPRWGYTVDTAVSQWAVLNQCDSEPTVETVDAVTTTTYASCVDDTAVVATVTDGAGHIWPGTSVDQSFFGETDWGFSASEVMWEFFEANARS